VRSGIPSAVVGDFDNDMDLDIYYDAATGSGASTVDLANVMLWNQGDGTFVADPLPAAPPRRCSAAASNGFLPANASRRSSQWRCRGRRGSGNLPALVRRDAGAAAPASKLLHWPPVAAQGAGVRFNCMGWHDELPEEESAP